MNGNPKPKTSTGGLGRSTMISIVVTLLFGLGYFYYSLPALNLQSPDFYTYIGTLCVIYVVMALLTSGFDIAGTGKSPGAYLKFIKSRCLPVGILILLLPPGFPAPILAGALLIGYLVADALSGVRTDNSRSGRFVGTFIRAREAPGGGANYTGLSLLAALLLFPASSAAAATIAFGVLDSVSTIAGLRYGHRRLPNGKSLEGSLAAFAFTVPVLLLFLAPVPAIVVAFVGALAELVLPVNDNLIVPFLLALLVTAFA